MTNLVCNVTFSFSSSASSSVLTCHGLREQVIFAVELQKWHLSLFRYLSLVAPFWRSCAGGETPCAMTDVSCAAFRTRILRVTPSISRLNVCDLPWYCTQDLIVFSCRILIVV
jgi:hypothetical protein